MLKFPKITEAQVLAAGKLLAATFVIAFVGSLLAAGFDVKHVTDLAVYQKAIYAGYLAVLGLVSSVVKSWLGNVAAARKARRG